MQIRIISVENVSAVTKAGKPYVVTEVTFKNLTFGKVEAKKIMPFGATADSAKILAGAAAGEVYEVDVTKNDAGYNDWTKVTKTVEQATADLSDSRTATTGATGGAQTQTAGRSNYETPEERAKKQIYIVRQSTIDYAIKILSIGAKTAPATDKILELAKVFEGHVFGDQPKPVESDLKKVAEGFETMEDDIPF